MTTIKERIAKMEVSVSSNNGRLGKIEGKIDKILQNHLPHIREAITKQSVKIAVIAAIIAALGVTFLDRILAFFLK